MEPYTLVKSEEKTCPHGVAVRFDCYQCAFAQVRRSQQGVCPHWVPKGQSCYACDRQKGRENPFTERPYIPVAPQKAQNTCVSNQEFIQQQTRTARFLSDDRNTRTARFLSDDRNTRTARFLSDDRNTRTARFLSDDRNTRTARFLSDDRMTGSNRSFGHQMLPGYTHPDDPNRKFPKPVNTIGGGRYRPPADPRRAMSSGRDQTRRTAKDSSLSFSMNRYLDDSKFMEEQQGDMWGNPIIKKNFPSPMDQKLTPQEEPMITNHGIGTRPSRKIDPAGRNENIFLNRSMVQPDMRHGNRFYEYMPETDRVSSQRRDIDNDMANTFRQQSAQIYSEMDYQKAFEKGASVGRGGQARW